MGLRKEVNLAAVLLAGGSGSRLWPLSREGYPKQFLNLNGDKTLLSETVDRALSIPVCDQVIAITNEDYRFIVASELQQSSLAFPYKILLEPIGRNTAPAIALAALSLVEDNPENLMLVLPSDHVIDDVEGFAEVVNNSLEDALDGKLVTFGVVPNSPHTGYGYINAHVEDDAKGMQVKSFVEKPDAVTAKGYVASGDYYWNSGMFLFRADAYIAALEKHCPGIMSICRDAWDSKKPDRDFVRVDVDIFSGCPDKSIDYAVMEKTKNAVVFPLNVGWSDVGSWGALWELKDRDEAGNVLVGDVLTKDVKESYIHSEGRLVAAIGVQGLVIVETPDALLVADQGNVQEVKSVVKRLKEEGRNESRLHRRVHRPWGSYESIVMADRFQVKRIIVNSGASLSLQKHHHRAEHWVVVKGTANITKGDEEMFLTEDESTYIPLGVVHRLSNPGVIPLELIEVQTGSYLGEDDIVRLDDHYNRS